MNLPTPSDIKRNLILLIDIAKLKPGSTDPFGHPQVSLSKSFSLAPFLFPVFFFLMMDYTLKLDENVSTTVIAYRSLLVYSTMWTLFPVVLYTRGFHEGIRHYVITRNWIMVANFIIIMIASFGGPFALIGLVAGFYINLMDWFILKDIFKISNGRAFGLFCVQIILNTCVMIYYFASVGIDFEAILQASRTAASG